MTTPQNPPPAPHQQPAAPVNGAPSGPPQPFEQAPQGQQFTPPQGQPFAPPQGQPFAPPQQFDQQPFDRAPHGWAGQPPAQQPSVGRTTPRRKLAGWITIVGALVVVLGSVLPWASVMLVGPVYGTEGDGILTIVCAVVVVLVALPAALGKERGWMFGVAAFFGLVAAAIAAYDLSNISSLVAGESMAQLGPGLPVIILGGLVILGAAVVALVRGRR